MHFPVTFGIITDSSPEAVVRLRTIIESIQMQQIPAYEILIVGDTPSLLSHKNVRQISFDESQKPKWITRKKNLITREASYEVIVYLHDYFAFEPGWYQNFVAFGTEFAACMNPIINSDGTRYRDWSLFYDRSSQAAREYAGAGKLENLLPYSETSLSKLMYFSGAYWIAKKTIMREIPLDERLSWGDGEDVIWSHRFRAKYSFAIDPHSKIRIIGKKKDPLFTEIRPHVLGKMKEYLTAHAPDPGYGCGDDMDVWRANEHWGPEPKERKLSTVGAA